MIIAIPVNSKESPEVNSSFARAKYFCIIDKDNNKKNFIENPAASQSGGAGVKASQVLIDQNVDAVLTPQIGENANDVLIKAKIDIYKSYNKSLEENINMLEERKLELLVNSHPGYHKHETL